MANYGMPLQNPANNDGRYFYETGRGGAFQTPITDVPQADWVRWEARSVIAKQPIWLTFLHAVAPHQLVSEQVAAQIWILLYDVNPDNPNLDALILAGMPARYSLGPIISAGTGGSIIYEASAEEVPCRVDPHRWPHGTRPYEVDGLPFNFGILAVASITPRFFTGLDVGDLQMAITARLQA